MFREMRRKEKLVSQEEASQFLKGGEYGTLATAGADGYPYLVPLNYAYEGNAIYFHTALEGHKIDNIKFNNKVCFSVVTHSNVVPSKFDSEYESITVFGRIVEIIAEDEKKEGLMLLLKKYTPEQIGKGIKYIEKSIKNVAVYKINVEHLSGKRKML